VGESAPEGAKLIIRFSSGPSLVDSIPRQPPAMPSSIPPETVTLDYGSVDRARTAYDALSRFDLKVGIGSLVGLGLIILALGALYPNPETLPLALVLGVMFLGLGAIVATVLLQFQDRKSPIPQSISISPEEISIKFDVGPPDSLSWNTPSTLIRIIERLPAAYHRPAELRFRLVGSPASRPEDTILSATIPPEAVPVLLATARSLGMSEYRARFRQKAGRIGWLEDEIQLRIGPPIDTESKGVSAYRRRVEPNPA
jgi:hypothetical protein